VFMGCLLPKSGSLRGDSEPSRSSSGDYTGDPPALYQAGRMERAGAGRAEWAVQASGGVITRRKETFEVF